jgi:hypothetical protein
VTGYGAIVNLGGTLGDHDHPGDLAARFDATARSALRPAGAETA